MELKILQQCLSISLSLPTCCNQQRRVQLDLKLSFLHVRPAVKRISTQAQVSRQVSTHKVQGCTTPDQRLRMLSSCFR